MSFIVTVVVAVLMFLVGSGQAVRAQDPYAGRKPEAVIDLATEGRCSAC